MLVLGIAGIAVLGIVIAFLNRPDDEIVELPEVGPGNAYVEVAVKVVDDWCVGDPLLVCWPDWTVRARPFDWRLDD
jgi:hypothetical protein